MFYTLHWLHTHTIRLFKTLIRKVLETKKSVFGTEEKIIYIVPKITRSVLKIIRTVPENIEDSKKNFFRTNSSRTSWKIALYKSNNKDSPENVQMSWKLFLNIWIVPQHKAKCIYIINRGGIYASEFLYICFRHIDMHLIYVCINTVYSRSKPYIVFHIYNGTMLSSA